MKDVKGLEHVMVERRTEVLPALNYIGGTPAVAVRFFHTEQSSAVLGLTLAQARRLAVQLIEAAGGVETA